MTASRDALGNQPREDVSQAISSLHIWPESDGFHVGSLTEANELLAARHYLGPIDQSELVICQWADSRVVSAQVWKLPTSRMLPSDGTWLELARWCLTADSGKNAGSRMHRAAVREIRAALPRVTTLVSYSDPSVGHTGALYRACNWRWAPTWHRLVPPPTGAGSWDGETRQEPKDRWIFAVTVDDRRESLIELEPHYESIAQALRERRRGR